MTAAARFTKADVKRAISGCVSSGLPIGQITIKPTGEIVILPATNKKAHDNDEWADLE